MKGWVIDSDAPSDGASSSLGIVFRKVVHKAIIDCWCFEKQILILPVLDENQIQIIYHSLFLYWFISLPSFLKNDGITVVLIKKEVHKAVIEWWCFEKQVLIILGENQIQIVYLSLFLYCFMLRPSFLNKCLNCSFNYKVVHKAINI